MSVYVAWREGLTGCCVGVDVLPGGETKKNGLVHSLNNSCNLIIMVSGGLVSKFKFISQGKVHFFAPCFLK